MKRLALVLLFAAVGISSPPLLRAEPCLVSGDGARLALELGFAELHRIYRLRVPGPSGETFLKRKIDALLERFVGIERFVDDTLGEAWEKSPERRKEWTDTLGTALRQRYLGKVGSPIGVRLEILSSVVECDEVRVSFKLHHANRKQPREVELRFYAEPLVNPELLQGPQDELPMTLRWRAFDVRIDGASLLETWRSRFRKVYAEGGVSAVEEQLRTLKERYPTQGL